MCTSCAFRAVRSVKTCFGRHFRNKKFLTIKNTYIISCACTPRASIVLYVSRTPQRYGRDEHVRCSSWVHAVASENTRPAAHSVYMPRYAAALRRAASSCAISRETVRRGVSRTASQTGLASNVRTGGGKVFRNPPTERQTNRHAHNVIHCIHNIIILFSVLNYA